MLKLLNVPAEAGFGPAGETPKRALDFFASKQIFPSDKRTHMTKLKKSMNTDFEEMLFFDDEPRNKNVEQLGVRFWLVDDGVSNHEIDNGVRHWRKQRGIA